MGGSASQGQFDRPMPDQEEYPIGVALNGSEKIVVASGSNASKGRGDGPRNGNVCRKMGCAGLI
jgi:hypothetical protein